MSIGALGELFIKRGIATHQDAERISAEAAANEQRKKELHGAEWHKHVTEHSRKRKRIENLADVHIKEGRGFVAFATEMRDFLRDDANDIADWHNIRRQARKYLDMCPEDGNDRKLATILCNRLNGDMPDTINEMDVQGALNYVFEDLI